MPALEFDKPVTSPYRTQCFITLQSKRKRKWGGKYYCRIFRACWWKRETAVKTTVFKSKCEQWTVEWNTDSREIFLAIHMLKHNFFLCIMILKSRLRLHGDNDQAVRAATCLEIRARVLTWSGLQSCLAPCKSNHAICLLPTCSPFASPLPVLLAFSLPWRPALQGMWNAEHMPQLCLSGQLSPFY